MERMTNVMSRTYPDQIAIFDSPPLLATSESRVLASLMGQIVLVVCAGTTPQDAVLQAAEGLDPEKAVSIILNQARGGFGAEVYGANLSYGQFDYGGRPS